MKKKMASSFVAVMMLLTVAAPKAEAFYLVHDAQSIVEQLAAFEKQFEATVKQYETVIQGRFNLMLAINRLNQIERNLGDLGNIMNTPVGVRLGYKALEDQWEAVYKLDATQANSKASGNYFADRYKGMLKSAAEDVENAKWAQGSVEKIVAEDGAMLKQLTVDNEKPQGALSVAQIGNQITALQTMQMMRLQAVIAQQQNAAAAYQAQKVIREEMARQAAENFYSAAGAVEYQKGQGPGIISGSSK